MKNVVLVLSVAVLFIGDCGQKSNQQTAPETGGGEALATGDSVGVYQPDKTGLTETVTAVTDSNLIRIGGVGAFALGKPMPVSVDGYDIKKIVYYSEEDGGTYTDYHVFVNNEKVIEISLSYDTDTIWSMVVFSDRYYTDKGIKVGQTLETLAEAYPSHKIVDSYYESGFDLDVVDTTTHPYNMRFNFDGEEYFIGDEKLLGYDYPDKFKSSDFKPGSKITAIRIWKSSR